MSRRSRNSSMTPSTSAAGDCENPGLCQEHLDSSRLRRRRTRHAMRTSSCLAMTLSTAVIFSLASSPIFPTCNAFSAKLSPPWTGVLDKYWRDYTLKIVTDKQNGARRRRKRSSKRSADGTALEGSLVEEEEAVDNEEEDAECNDFESGPSTSSYRYLASSSTALAASAVPIDILDDDDDNDQDDADGEDDENSQENQPTVKSCLRPLLRMTRPSNFPGVILFHILGVHRALSAGLASSSIPISYSRSLLLQTLRKPQMIIVTLALILTSATSMIVNDYYDARSGVDARNLLTQALQKSSSEGGGDSGTYSHLDKPLATGAVPMIIAKRFLSYLYAVLLICLTAVPGVAARLTVVIAAMLTFWYTQHLKPRTWLKNVSCAGLIGLSPFTSGSAALHLVLEGAGVTSSGGISIGSVGPALASLWRLVLTLFAGFMSREIIMDVCDYDGDKDAGVRTVPVKYGKRFATRVSLAFASVTALLAVSGPGIGLMAVWEKALAATSSYGDALALIIKTPLARKFILAAIGSGLILRRAIQVAKTEGEDMKVAARAVDEQKEISVLFILASFI